MKLSLITRKNRTISVIYSGARTELKTAEGDAYETLARYKYYVLNQLATSPSGRMFAKDLTEVYMPYISGHSYVLSVEDAWALSFTGRNMSDIVVLADLGEGDYRLASYKTGASL